MRETNQAAALIMLASLSVVFSALISASAADLSSEYAHHAVLDPQELMKLYWTVDWNKETPGGYSLIYAI